MTDLGLSSSPIRQSGRRNGLLVRLASSRGFQDWAARVPVLRRIVRREGEAMFDLIAGFCHSQVLRALVEFDILNALVEAPEHESVLARDARMPEDRMRMLLRAAQALDLVRCSRMAVWRLTVRGAALATVPGVSGMIRHHDVLYDDMRDVAAFFRGEQDTQLAHFWPYVFGAEGAKDPKTAQDYSRLMADSQLLVAEDTLGSMPSLRPQRWMDVGGGTGAFLTAVAGAFPQSELVLFDLPAVVPAATERFEAAGLSTRANVISGSFQDDELPSGADVISLVRVLYDHGDDTVTRLLAKIHAALPAGGRIVVSEPMTGGETPNRSGDIYFSLYCMAMRTGRARSAEEICSHLTAVGFENLRVAPSRRPFVTSVITAVKAD